MATPPSAPSSDPLQPAVRVHAGELIYDYAWYSQASAADPATYCFAVAARSHPIHLYDACTAEVRCSYRPYNALDELSPAYSVAFGGAGTKVYAGGLAAIHIFDIQRPGRDHDTLHTFKRKEDGQPGIISCISFDPGNSGLMAAGSYSGVAALYDCRTKEQLCLLEGHVGGVTHVAFSADGNYLYTGARKDGCIYCWDARNASGVLYTIHRQAGSTNQRIYFDIEPAGRHLATGGEDGWVRFFDLREGSEAGKFCAAGDVVNGCQFHPVLPLLATASGQRRFSALVDGSQSDASGSGSEEDDDDMEEQEAGASNGNAGSKLGADENVLRLWRLGMQPLVAENGGSEIHDPA